jgi:hypothetical protein
MGCENCLWKSLFTSLWKLVWLKIDYVWNVGHFSKLEKTIMNLTSFQKRS